MCDPVPSYINTITTDVYNPVVPAYTIYQPFKAITTNLAKPTMNVYMRESYIDGQPMMVIRYEADEVVAITKEQAMKFFGLVEQPIIVDPQGDNELY